jgi:alpha-beta hydrolase superfamily lysophospholipase
MPYHEDRFTARDGLELHEKTWLPERDVSGVVVLVHGIFEHSGRYAHVAERLNRAGYALVAMDLRGHGKSDGERIWVESFDEYLADLEVLLERVRGRHPGKPLYLLGFSMGGAVVTLFTILYQPEIAGLILSAPALSVGRSVFPLIRRLAAFVSRIWPRLRLVRFGFMKISRDPAVVEGFRNDRLVFQGRFPIRTGAEVLRAAKRISQRMEGVSVPLLILHGTGDLITDAEGSRRLYLHASSADRTLKLYEGLYHDLLHEPERDQILADLIEWLRARSAPARAARLQPGNDPSEP